jgi:hypothetical protein
MYSLFTVIVAVSVMHQIYAALVGLIGVSFIIGAEIISHFRIVEKTLYALRTKGIMTKADITQTREWTTPIDITGIAFCSGCRKTDKKENLLFNKETGLFCHKSCLK